MLATLQVCPPLETSPHIPSHSITQVSLSFDDTWDLKYSNLPPHHIRRSLQFGCARDSWVFMQMAFPAFCATYMPFPFVLYASQSPNLHSTYMCKESQSLWLLSRTRLSKYVTHVTCHTRDWIRQCVPNRRKIGRGRYHTGLRWQRLIWSASAFGHLYMDLIQHISLGCWDQWSGRFLGVIGWDPSVCKSNRLHVDILRFSFIKLGYIL